MSTEAPTGVAPILIVDDNAGKRLSIHAILKSLGHPVVEVASGEDALRAVTSQTFAVILMDVQMPGMNGYETASFIRARGAEPTPIIFITAHARDEAQIPAAYASGAVDFIWSPIVAEILRAKVSIFVRLFLKSDQLAHSLKGLRDSEARTRSVLENVADGILTVSDKGVIESFNRAATGLLGYSEQEAIGQPLSLMVGEVLPSEVLAGDDQLLSTGTVRATESIGRRKDGTTFPMEFDLSVVQLGTRAIQIGCLRDISERRTYTETLRHRALHDDLTGLPNRVLFGDRVDHAIRAALRSGESLALLLMDLDDFKLVNDTLGHQHGDALLQLVAARVLGCLRNGDTVARLGGDEFGILPGGGIAVAGAATVVWKIQQALEPPFLVNGHTIDVRASIGITLAPAHGDNIDDLLRRADLAMYDAKRSGSGYAMFAVEQEETPARRLELLGDMRACIERDELVLHYQPKIDLATCKTVGVEALIRWNHPSGRLFMPGDFMPEAESSELMIPITEWVLNEALRQLSIWRDDGFDLTMAVNLGARCLVEGTSIFETVDELTNAWGIPPDKLTFELTESALLDTAVPGLLAQLERMDERLSIDDFGTGYSSLAYLQRLPVVEIKADRSFVSTMATVDDDAVIVRSTIDLAHNLSLKVVAEGVEDEQTLALLLAFGCDEAQGYYFSRPIAAPELVPWLLESPFGLLRRPAPGAPGAAVAPDVGARFGDGDELVRALHCDESESYRRELLELLRSHGRIEIVGQVSDHAELLAQAFTMQPDVILLDLDGRADERLVARLSAVCSAGLVVLARLPAADPPALVAQADAVVSKSATPDEIARAVLHAGSPRGPDVSGKESAARDVLWVGRLRRALKEGRFVLFAQPIVALATDTVVRHELLIRMLGDDGQLIAPGEFLPVAERFGLVSEIDRWVLREAAGLAARGHAVQINLSGVTLADPDIGACVQRELVVAGAPPGLVAFEITETALAANKGLAAAFIDRVRSLGCLVALDDFGMGYGGFGYLKSFSVDSLKIDRSCVSDLLTDPASEHVVRAVVQLAIAFGLDTVAEGVEDPDTLERVRALGVGHAQGFHFARPAPAVEVLSTATQRAEVRI